MNNIPRAAWPDIREMYLNKGMTRPEIADHYGTTMPRIATALRHMECTLPKAVAMKRNAERIASYNHGKNRVGPDIIRPAPPYALNGLINAAVMITRTSANDIKAHRRNRYFVHVRWAIWYLAQGHFSFSSIGKSFGRDHTTIIHGCQQAHGLIETSATFRAMVDAIRNEALRTKAMDRATITALIERIAA